MATRRRRNRRDFSIEVVRPWVVLVVASTGFALQVAGLVPQYPSAMLACGGIMAGTTIVLSRGGSGGGTGQGS